MWSNCIDAVMPIIQLANTRGIGTFVLSGTLAQGHSKWVLRGLGSSTPLVICQCGQGLCKKCASWPLLIKRKALKCETLGAELAHTYTLYYNNVCIFYADDHLPNRIMYPPFTLTTIYLILMLVGNDRQLNLLRGNFNDWKWPPWPCESEKETINSGKKRFS